MGRCRNSFAFKNRQPNSKKMENSYEFLINRFCPFLQNQSVNHFLLKMIFLFSNFLLIFSFKTTPYPNLPNTFCSQLDKLPLQFASENECSFKTSAKPNEICRIFCATDKTKNFSLICIDGKWAKLLYFPEYNISYPVEILNIANIENFLNCKLNETFIQFYLKKLLKKIMSKGIKQNFGK